MPWIEESRTDFGGLRERVSRKHLVNILNYVNFKEGCVVVNFRSTRDGTTLSLKAVPGPCCGDTANLTWSVRPPADIDTAYEYTDFFIDKGSRVVVVGGQLTDVSPLGMTILLPEHCYATSRRRVERFSSAPVEATLSKNKWRATGPLQDFSGAFIKVRLDSRNSAFVPEKRDTQSIQVVLRSGETTVYDGDGTIKRHITNGGDVDLVVELIPSIQEESKDFHGIVSNPPLIAICRHPLSDKIVRLHVAKTSFNTFVINEDPEHATLFQGLIIPDVRIDFGAGDSAKCSAKVVAGEAGTWLVSILDMPLLDQRKLFSFVENETGMSSGVSTVIDPEDLIEFFFEVGFIYPEKYAGLTCSRTQFKEILSHLYIDTPSISQHFVRYNNGVIQAHICMVRFYERAWVVHHHTAVGGLGAGSAVLTQIFRYIHGYSALPSTGMDYVMTYFRPENRFPNRVLGGLVRLIDTPSLSSIDPFAYLHIHFDRSVKEPHDKGRWRLEPVNYRDLIELEAFYKGVSGGLALKAFGLEAADLGRQTTNLDVEFEKAGLRRRKSSYALRDEGRLKVVVMSLDSDVGLNMSNLMKSMHVFVLDEQGLPLDVLMAQLNGLSFMYEDQEIPVLVFPSSYVTNQGAMPDKIYNLLTFSVSVGEQFVEFVERMTNRTVRRMRTVPKEDEEGKASEQ